jgi:hypothetical protein
MDFFKPKMANQNPQNLFRIFAAILDFLKLLIKKRLAHTRLIQKRVWKNVENFQNFAKKSNFDPPFWIDPPFLDNLTK